MLTLRELINHVRVRDAGGNFSDIFCAGCEYRRLEPCPLHKITTLVVDLESRRMKGLVNKDPAGKGAHFAADRNKA